MPRYWVRVIRSSYYEVEAADREDAIDQVLDGTVEELDCETSSTYAEPILEQETT